MSVRFNYVDLQKDAPYSGSTVFLGRGTYGAPERDVQQIHVPGRNGDLLLDYGGYKNIQVTYPCSILDHNSEVSQWLRSVLYSAHGYCKLEDDYHPDEFRLAEYRGPFEPEVFSERGNDTAKVDLVFNCKPQRFLKIGDKEQHFFTGRPDGNGKDVFTIDTSCQILKIRYRHTTSERPTMFSAKYKTYANTWTDITSSVISESGDDYTDFLVNSDAENINLYQFSINNNSNEKIESISIRYEVVYDSGISIIEKEVYDSIVRYTAHVDDEEKTFYCTKYTPQGWFGPPRINIKGQKNENCDTLVGEFMGRSFKVDISKIPTGTWASIVIDCDDMRVTATPYDYTVEMMSSWPIPAINPYFLESWAEGLDYLTMSAQTREWRI